MKIIKRNRDKSKGSLSSLEDIKKEQQGWKILVVDDDQDILAVTRLNLKTFRFEGRVLQFFSASSAKEAQQILDNESDIAVAIVDVVMESDDAGLKLVDYIRKEMNNQKIRIIIRTGQPGHAPERYVIDHYDIDDFKDKSELTAIKLYTTVRSAIKSYRDLQVIDQNRSGLEMILNAAPGMYLHPSGLSMSQFFQGVLTQIISLCHLGSPQHAEDCRLSANGCIATFDGKDVTIQAGIGNLAQLGKAVTGRAKELAELFIKSIKTGCEINGLSDDALLIPLEVMDKPDGFIYIENIRKINASDRHLLRLFTIQCASALENNRLHQDLINANEGALRMLAVASEFKDTDTAEHVKRLARQTMETALELGISEDVADSYAQASLMHDLGKIGIPDAVLMKPGRLTDDEFAIIKDHPVIGAQILDGDPNFELAHQVAMYHHERWDGSGYPKGLAGEDIPMAARIVAIVDVFDALVSKRPYKKPWPVEDALREIASCSGSHFDPAVVEAFLRLHKRRGHSQHGGRNADVKVTPRRALDGSKAT